MHTHPMPWSPSSIRVMGTTRLKVLADDERLTPDKDIPLVVARMVAKHYDMKVDYALQHLDADELVKAYHIRRWTRAHDIVFYGIVAPGGSIVTEQYRQWFKEQTPYGESSWTPMVPVPKDIEVGDRVQLARIKGQVRLVGKA